MARWQFRPPIERYRGGFRLNLDDEERDLIRRLLGEMQSLLVGPSDNPALVRVFPAAYHLPEHAEHDAEYQRLMREELVASRLVGIDTVTAALATKPPLDEAQVSALMQGLNGLRLVLGTVLDLSEDDDPDDIADDDPRAGEHQLYSFLSWLLEWTVRTMTET
ncbi:MAG: hypothetical protein FD127_258 [Acidimicrobiaceae bacterium]|nr:MAG: hypothetical protein FD127_258 [Acidimicrobiaceae bacterium]